MEADREQPRPAHIRMEPPLTDQTRPCKTSQKVSPKAAVAVPVRRP
jgi:hypothetical protein